MNQIFRIVANRISQMAGTPYAFLIALIAVIMWAATGTFFSYSDTWQLVINTGTTIVTFLMVFLIQNTQNRDSKAMQLKLDELIRVTKSARDRFVDLESLTDEELVQIDQEFKKFHEKEVTTVALRKLHHRIQAEHQRRVSLRGAGKALHSFLHKNISNKKTK